MVVVVVWPGAVEMVVVVVFFGPTWFTSCASLAVMRRLNSPAETAEMTNRASRPP